MSELRVGCAGWSYQDWVGPVYPRSVPPSRWLEVYAQLFPTVEIDATFDALPSASTVEGWIQRAATLPGFTFSVRMTQDATHGHLAAGRLDDAGAAAATFLDRVVKPMEAAKRLEAVLVQLPPEFAHFERVGEATTLDALQHFLAILEPHRRRVAVEFRHGSWFEHVGERLAVDVQEALLAQKVSVARVDGLGSVPHRSRTADWSYFRFYGRRTHIPPSERTLSHAPFNYLYPKEEVQDLARQVQDSMAKDAASIVVFANYHRGQAVTNAMDFLEAMGRPRPKPAVTPSRGATLDEY